MQEGVTYGEGLKSDSDVSSHHRAVDQTEHYIATDLFQHFIRLPFLKLSCR